MAHASHFIIRLEKQALAVKKLKVFSFYVAHHFNDIIIATGVEYLPIAKAANWALRVCIDAQDWHLSIPDHARRLQESSITSQWQDQLDAGIGKVLLRQLIVLFYSDRSPALLESLDHFISYRDVYVCSFGPNTKKMLKHR